ncbi:MAG: hypothetical protein GX946_05055 [Oligosphaeraceae bacterium]|nr:hypothetical protein [Oligosphaeraceae bacterium]
MKRHLSALLSIIFLPLMAYETVSTEWQSKWSCGGKPIAMEDGALKVVVARGDQLILHPLDIKSGQSYVMCAKIQGAAGMDVFWFTENNTEGVWQNKAVNVTTDGNEQVLFMSFNFPKQIKTGSHSVFRINDGSGEIKIKSLSIKEKAMSGLFTNGDFNEGGAWWELKENTQIVDAGEYGMVLEQYCKEKATRAVAHSAPVDVKELKTYRISFNVRGIEGFGDKALTHYFRVYPLDSRNNPIIGTDKTYDCMGNWQVKRYEFQIPSRQFSVRFAVESIGPCKVQFDNFSLEEFERPKQAAEIILSQPYNYRDGVFASNPSSSITGSVSVNFDQASSALLTLADKDGQEIWSRRYSSYSKDLSFCVPAPAMGDISVLALTTFDQAMNVLTTVRKELHSYKPNNIEVTFRDDGVTLLNGKPFFMISHWWDTRRGDSAYDMDFLKEAGFNSVLLINRTPERFPELDLAQKHGMLGIVELWHDFTQGTPEEQAALKKKWSDLIRKYQNHPALFCYFGQDEPMWGGQQLEIMKDAYKVARDADPYHPLWLNEAPCGEVPGLHEYAAGTCDTYGVDIYPIGAPHGSLVEDRTMTAVGKHTDRCMDAVEANRPVWMILQAFAWAHIRANTQMLPADQVEGIVYPTYEENRFMAYNAIVHGATGIHYHYIGYSPYTPDYFWKSLRQVTLELQYMSPIFTSRTVYFPAMKCADRRIRFLTKRHEGRNYYLITNESPETVKAEFTSCPESHLNILLESDGIDVADGSFTMDIPAYGVKILADCKFPEAQVLFKPETYVPFSAPVPHNDVRYKNK